MTDGPVVLGYARPFVAGERWRVVRVSSVLTLETVVMTEAGEERWRVKSGLRRWAAWASVFAGVAALGGVGAMAMVEPIFGAIVILFAMVLLLVACGSRDMEILKAESGGLVGERAPTCVLRQPAMTWHMEWEVREGTSEKWGAGRRLATIRKESMPLFSLRSTPDFVLESAEGEELARLRMKRGDLVQLTVPLVLIFKGTPLERGKLVVAKMNERHLLLDDDADRPPEALLVALIVIAMNWRS